MGKTKRMNKESEAPAKSTIKVKPVLQENLNTLNKPEGKESSTTLNSTPQKTATDRRVIKTQRAIHDAFHKLIATHDLSKITVSELAREADIDRKTFYLHFSSIDDLIKQEALLLVDRIVEALLVNEKGSIVKYFARQQNTSKTFNAKDSITTGMGNVLIELKKVVEEDPDLYTSIFSSALSMDRMAEALYEPVYQSILKSDFAKRLANDQALSYVVRFYIMGTLSMFTHWFNEGCLQPVETIVEVFERALENRMSDFEIENDPYKSNKTNDPVNSNTENDVGTTNKKRSGGGKYDPDK